MTGVAIVLLGLCLSLLGSTAVLRGRKLQAGVLPLLAVWGATGLAAMVYFHAAFGSGAVVVGVLWAGAFLTWFGVRSHVESSILLRMLYLLRVEEMDGDEVVAAYEKLYGPRQRLDELLRAGLAERDAGGMRVSAKGKRVLAAVDWLR